MDNQKLCTTCNQALKWVPPGISKKTNRSYNGFYACPDNHPQQKAPAFQNPNPPSASAFTKSLEADFDKQRMIIRQHSQDMAIQSMELMNKLCPEDLMKQIEDYAVEHQVSLPNSIMAQIKNLTEFYSKDVEGK